MNSKDLYTYLMEHPEEAVRYIAMDDFETFARYQNPKLDMTDFHHNYYRILDMFAHNRIRRLIISVPPQHGKSLGSSQMLPQFLLGLNPDTRIAICSYAAALSQGFNRAVQRGMVSPQYASLFPKTTINANRQRSAGNAQCNANVTEIVGREGFVKAVGRGGPLTGVPVDVAILDDVYKDFQEANSETVRTAAWDWYTSVVKTRLHKDSREIIVFTRWHEDDIIGKIEKSGETIVRVKEWKDLEDVDPKTWILVNFPAIKVGPPTELDPREEGQALWPNRHPIEELDEKRLQDPNKFECLYQGDPGSAEGRLYGEFKTYSDPSQYGTLLRRGAYVDVADQGNDFLAAVTYDVYKSDFKSFNEKTRKYEPMVFILVTDIEYTQEGTDVTYISVPRMLNERGTRQAWVESNAGGSQFEKNISPKTKARTVPFHQSGNKESRIVSNAAEVNARIVFPVGWKERWPKAADHLARFLRMFRANAHDDIEDCITGIYEKEVMGLGLKGYGGQGRGIRRVN